MSFDKKVWLADEDLTEKEMNDLENRVDFAFEETKLQFEDILDYPIDMGKHTSGYWEKFKSGKLVHMGQIEIGANVNEFVMNYPVPFIDVPYSVQLTGSYIGGESAQQVNITYTDFSRKDRLVVFRRLSGDVPNIKSRVNYTAIGRWK